ncbi:MAG: hypothetical protein ABDH28_06535 [Brevinematia bacterium]
MGKRYMPFVGFTIFVGVVSLLGCAIISPDPASELLESGRVLMEA